MNPVATSTITQTICAGDSIVVAGTTYNTTGIYTDTLSCELMAVIVHPNHRLDSKPSGDEYDHANDLRRRFDCSSGHDL